MPGAAQPNVGVYQGWTDLEDGWGDQMNANLRALDALVQARVADKDLADPPASPSNGDAYIVAGSGTGAWAGQGGKIARWTTTPTTPAWEFFTTRTGWRVWVADEAKFYRYSGSAWVDDTALTSALLGAVNGVASLDSTGKLTAAQLPDLAVSDYLGSVASQAAMLALTGQKGDWCIRSDDSKVYVITGTDPTVIGGWTAMSYPSSAGGGAVSFAVTDISNNTTTPALADAGKIFLSNFNVGSGSPTFTIPPNASVAYPIGTVIGLRQLGTACHTVTAGAGVTINTPLNRTKQPRGVGATIFLHKRAADTWEVYGDAAYTGGEGMVSVTGHGAASETAVAALANDWGRFADGSPNQTFTFPSDSAAAIAVGTVIRFILTTTTSGGNLTFLAGSGATLNYDSLRCLPRLSRRFQWAMAVKVATDTWDLIGDLDQTGYVAINDQTGTAYTAVLTDAGRKVRMNNGGANAVTIPPNSSVAFPIGATIAVRQVGAGKTTLTPGSGVTFNVPAGYTAAAGRLGSELMLHKVATDTWDVTGDLST